MHKLGDFASIIEVFLALMIKRIFKSRDSTHKFIEIISTISSAEFRKSFWRNLSHIPLNFDLVMYLLILAFPRSFTKTKQIFVDHPKWVWCTKGKEMKKKTYRGMYVRLYALERYARKKSVNFFEAKCKNDRLSGATTKCRH